MQKWQKHTLKPKWNDTKYCLVQEPKTQNLHVEMADHDAVNLKVTIWLSLSHPARCLTCAAWDPSQHKFVELVPFLLVAACSNWCSFHDKQPRAD